MHDLWTNHVLTPSSSLYVLSKGGVYEMYLSMSDEAPAQRLEAGRSERGCRERSLIRLSRQSRDG